MPDFSDIDADEVAAVKPTHGRSNQDMRAQILQLQEHRIAPPPKTDRRCKVCTSDHRQYIDSMIAKGTVPFTTIVKLCPPDADGNKPSRKSIARHAKNHLNVNDAVIRGLLEFEAEKASQNWEEDIRGAITQRGILEVAVRKAFEDISTGVIQVEPRDMLAMMDKMQKMDEAASSTAVDEARMILTVLIQAIQDNTDQETWNHIADSTEKALLAAGVNLDLMRREEVVDAELVAATPIELER